MATFLDSRFPSNAVAGLQTALAVTARDGVGAVDAGYVGTVHFASSDAGAVLPADYTFTGGDAGVHAFAVRLSTPGAQTITITDGGGLTTVLHVAVAVRPPGWGIDDEARLPYGDAASGIGVHIVRALVASTKEVEVEVSGLVRDNSPYLAGDALNPATWTLQRLDTAAFLHVVGVTQTGTYSYTLLCLEEFGDASVTHVVSSSTLLDSAGAAIVAPRSASFLGVLDATKLTPATVVASLRSSTRDLANPQLPNDAAGFVAGTLQLDGAGDYRLESGAALVKKLILRRLMARAGDYFHLPNYGLGLRLKAPVFTSDLGAMKAAVEQQCLQEREVTAASATIELDPNNGAVYITIRGRLQSGEPLEVTATTAAA